MDEFGYVAIQFAAQIPALAVLAVGLVLLAVRRRALAGRAGPLAVAGCVVLLAGTLASIAWTSAFPWLVADGELDVRQFGLVTFAVGIVLTLIHATGLALVIGAVLAGARPAPPPAFALPPHDPPGPPAP